MLVPALPSSNIYLSILGCTLATVCAYLILMKYQKLIQQFSRDNVQLGERLGARTYALEKANEEMRQEIAERGRVEKALMESESRFRTVIREAALGIALIDKRGHVIEGNPALLAMLGYSPEELRGMDFTRINHPENAESSWNNFQKLLTGQQDVCRVETRYIRKDGWIGWGRQSISLVRETGGKPQFAIALFEDITERRESEEKIRTYQEQLQSLASELSLTEERERRRLATVLHDHIAQLLVVAKAKFEKIQESTLYRSFAKPMEEIRRLIDESIRYTRSLVFELSPPILYDLGFEPAMEWLAEHMQQQYGLVVVVEDDDQPKPLDNEARVLLFRAVRELLFNVLKHAQTSRARVCMLGEGDHLRVIVEDNGVGFTPDKLCACVRQNRRFRSIQHPGAPELFRRPHGDRVDPGRGHPSHSDRTRADRHAQEGHPLGDPSPRQATPTAGGPEGGISTVVKIAASLHGGAPLAAPGGSRPFFLPGRANRQEPLAGGSCPKIRWHGRRPSLPPISSPHCGFVISPKIWL